MIEDQEKETHAVMTESEVGAEFLLGYGDFPNNYALDAQKVPENARGVLRFFRKRLAFHVQVAGILSGFRSLISTCMRLAIFETMSQPEGDQRLWFVIDELDTLGRRGNG
jgi:hypothetical protein